MAFWCYMLKCADRGYYVGHTDALEQRIGCHQFGKGSDFTARRQPVTLVWSQDFSTRIEALKAERRIKGWSRAKKQALIAGDWIRVSELAVSRAARPSTSLRTNGGLGPAVKNSVRPELVEGSPPDNALTPNGPPGP